MEEKTDMSTNIAPTLKEIEKELLRMEIKRRIEREHKSSKRTPEDN